MKVKFVNKLKIAQRMISTIRGPLSASLFITRKCNLNCPYCRATKPDWQDLDAGTWFSIIDRLRNWGVRLFSITGGEPMIRSDIYEIINHISQTNRAIPWLISNFKTMTRENIDRLADAGLLFLTASLDSLSGKKVKSNAAILDLLVYAKTKGIIPSTITVISRDNLHEIARIMKTVTERGIIFDIGLFQHVGGLFSPSEPTLKVVDFQRLDDVRKMILNHKLKTGLVAPSWHFLNADWQYYQNMSWKCPSDRDAFLVVNNDGRLMPCQEFVSSIRVLDIDSLDNPDWRQQKAAIVNHCRGCFYGCYYQKVNVGFKDVLLDFFTMLKV